MPVKKTEPTTAPGVARSDEELAAFAAFAAPLVGDDGTPVVVPDGDLAGELLEGGAPLELGEQLAPGEPAPNAVELPEPRFVVNRDALGGFRRGDLVTVAQIPGGAARVAELVARGALVEA
jgi:hypothetical protein